MQLVQFQQPREGRRLGVVSGHLVLDVTAVRPDVTRVTEAFAAAQDARVSLAKFLAPLVESPQAAQISYAEMLANRELAQGPVLRPAVDHADLYRVFVTGTGLTHLGSMQ